MAQFQVDPEMLGEAAHRLDRYLDRITEISGRSAVGDLGDARLTTEVIATEQRIARELGEAGEVVRGMARVLRGAGAAYRGADDGVRAAAAGGSPTVGSSP